MSASGRTASPDRMRVLYVDPNRNFADRVRASLGSGSGADVTVTTAATAERASEILRTEDVDCVVSANDLPDADGVGLLETVRSVRPGCPFVLIVDEDRTDLAMEALSTEHTAFLRRLGDEEGDLERLATRVYSIAQFGRMQRYLRERKIPFRSLVEYSTDLVTIIEPDGKIAYASPAADYVVGYDPTDLVGRSAFELVHPEDRETVQETFYSAVEEPDQVPTATYRFQHADGSWRYVESRGSNKLEDPAIEGFVVNTRDITQRKRMAQRIRENRNKITRLHDTAAVLRQCDTTTEVCERTVDAAADILAFDICVVDIEEDGRLPTIASKGLPPEGTPTMSVDEGLAGKTYRSGESYLIEDTRQAPDVIPQGRYLSALSIPLSDHGIFQAAATEAGAFDQYDLELAELLGVHVAAALDRVDRDGA